MQGGEKEEEVPVHQLEHLVGVAPGEEVSDEDFKVQLESLNEELETLNAEAHELEERISENVMQLMEE